LEARAAALKARGDAAGALAAWEKAAEIAPRSARVQDEIGFLLAVLNRRQEAVSHFEQALKFDSRFAAAHYHLGVAAQRQAPDPTPPVRAHDDQIAALTSDLGKDRLEVRFFGRRAFFLRTPALLAFFTGAPLIPSFVYRGDDGRFNIDCGPAIHVSRAGNRDDNIRAATQQVADEIERYIRRYPHYWYQFYRFWQSQTD